MYKIIYDNKIIDVVKTLKCVRYNTSADKIISTGFSTAHGIYSSNHLTYYILGDRKVPQGFIDKGYKIVKLISINEEEFNKIHNQLKIGNTVYENPNHIYLVRKRKIEEMSAECNKVITEGISILLSDGFHHKFRLTLEDQMNLLMAERDLQNGALGVVYHETNGLCKHYSSRDMKAIIKAANEHRRYHTTYFNLLKYCINNMNTVQDIIDIKYGVDFSELNIDNDQKIILKEKLNG